MDNGYFPESKEFLARFPHRFFQPVSHQKESQDRVLVEWVNHPTIGILGRTLFRLGQLSSSRDFSIPPESKNLTVSVKKDLFELYPVFKLIDAHFADHRQGVLGIDGPSSSGKTRLSKILSLVYACEALHMDDFFLPRNRVTSDRLAEVGGNIDYERFGEEVVGPLRKSLPIRYRRFDCATQEWSDPVLLPPAHFLVVEGVYSLHPKFRSLYDLTIFLDVCRVKKVIRIFRRNGMNLALSWKHLTQWIPMENRYFQQEKLREFVDLIL